MSDPVTNVEIEDVLASIRRLVSEDSRPEIAAKDVPGKLVLTPALRISDAPGGAESDAPAAVAAGGEAAPAVETAGHAIPDDNYAEDTEEPQPLESAALEARFADMVEDEDDAGEVLTTRVEPVFEAAPIRSTSFQPEPEQSEPVDWEDAVAEAPASAHAPADAGFDDYETDTVEDEGEAEFVDAPDYEAAGDDADLEDLSEFGGEEEGILDEETLRELVTDIVRQELQGALGERITRNVRKLVRREIHRALTSHDLQ